MVGNHWWRLLYVTEPDLAVHEMPANADAGSYRKSVDVLDNAVAYGVEDQGLFILDSLDHLSLNMRI